MAAAKDREQEIACQQILLEDASVYSVQWLYLPGCHADGVTAEFLFDRYLKLIRGSTFSLIRPAVGAGGVRFQLVGSSFALLAFAPPEWLLEQSRHAVRLRINGGFVVQAGECDRGVFSLAIERDEEGARITVQLSDYCPLLLGSPRPSRLRRLIYGATQAYFHKVVTVRYLSTLYRELTGEKPRTCVKKVRVKEVKAI